MSNFQIFVGAFIIHQILLLPCMAIYWYKYRDLKGYYLVNIFAMFSLLINIQFKKTALFLFSNSEGREFVISYVMLFYFVVSLYLVYRFIEQRNFTLSFSLFVPGNLLFCTIASTLFYMQGN